MAAVAGTGLLTKVLGIAVLGAWDAWTVGIVVALLLGFGAAALVLAQQCWELGEQALAQHVYGVALADLPEDK